MANTLTQLNGAGAINGTADDEIIIAQHDSNGGTVPDPQTIAGGSGADVIFGDHAPVFDTSNGGNALISLATDLDDPAFWSTAENPDVGDTSIPYTTVVGKGNGSNVQWFSVTVGAGETLTVDVDHARKTSGTGDFDSFLEVFTDGGGSQGTSDDDDPVESGLGSRSDLIRDSYLSITNTGQTAQVYNIRLSAFFSDPNPPAAIPADATFMLNVSVTGHAATATPVFGADNISGDVGEDILYGGGGNDIIDGGSGDDTYYGGSGDDTLLGSFGSDSFDGGSGIDTLQIEGTAVDDAIAVGDIDFDIDLEAGTDGFGNTYADIENINAGAGDDTIKGSVSSNTINTGAGNDTVSDNAGSDKINLGAGDDTFLARAGANDFASSGDSINGGDDNDTLLIQNRSNLAQSFDMETGVYITTFTKFATNFENFSAVTTGPQGSDTFDIKGTDGVNTIIGGVNNDTIEGGAGADSLDGGDGIDTLSYEGASSGVSLAFTTGAGVGGDANGDTFTNFEAFRGSDFGDFVTASQTTSYTYEGRGGNDNFGLFSLSEGGGKTFNGGADFDTMDLLQQGATATIDLRDDTLISMERLDFDAIGSTVLDSVQINASQMDDVTDVRAATHVGDTVQLEIFMADRTNLDLSDITVTGFTEAGDQIRITGDTDNETITGTNANDSISGNGGNDTIQGGAGADTLDGGGGTDTIDYSASSEGVFVHLTVAAVTESGGDATGDVVTNFENFIGSQSNDTVFGIGVLEGRGGDDTMWLVGAGTAETEITGGADEDRIIVRQSVGAGATFDGGSQSDTLSARLIGAIPGVIDPTVIDLTNGVFTNFETLSLEISSGFDENLTVLMDAAQFEAAGFQEISSDRLPIGNTQDDITLELTMGSLTALDLGGIVIGGDFGDKPADVIRIIGDGEDETIIGADVAENISTGGGDDTIFGSAGADTINGGADDDTVSYANSQSGVFVTLGENLFLFGDAEGDVLAGIETVIGSAFVDYLASTDDTVTLFGGAGEDTLESFGARDELFGGADNDTFETGGFTTDVQAGEIYHGGEDFDTLEVSVRQTQPQRVLDFTDATLTSIEELSFYSDDNASKGDVTAKISAFQFNVMGLNTISVANRGTNDAFTVEVELFDDPFGDAINLSFLALNNGFGSQTGDGFRITSDGSNFFALVTGSFISDTYIGSGVSDNFYVRGGLDDINLGGGTDFLLFEVETEPLTAGASYDGGGGSSDFVLIDSAEATDFRDVILQNFEVLEFTGGASLQTVTLTAAQFLQFTTIDGVSFAGFSSVIEVDVTTAADFDFSGLLFGDWNIGNEDQIIFNDTNAAAQTITGTEQDDQFNDDAGAGSQGDTLFGGAGDDVFRHGNLSDADFIDGGADFDTVDYSASTTTGVTVDLQAGTVDYGASSATLTHVEQVIGTQSADDLSGSTLSDVLDGHDGADTLSGGQGIDTLMGSGGADSIFGQSARDDLYGGTGDDVIYGGGGGDTIDGGTNNDSLYGGGSADIISGGGNADVIFGGSSNDTINGDSGGDRLSGDGGADTLYGGSGVDTLEGRNGGDDLFGGSSGDILIGGGGNDDLHGDGGADELKGGTNNDDLFGGTGDDILKSGSGMDELYGGIGDDVLVGGSGRDALFGGDDDDRLSGNIGDDTLNGGDGSDIFIFADNFGEDIIEDYDALDANEVIDLRGVAEFVDFADLLANHLGQDGNDVLIDDLDGNIITIQNALIGQFDENDFVFV